MSNIIVSIKDVSFNSPILLESGSHLPKKKMVLSASVKAL